MSLFPYLMYFVVILIYYGQSISSTCIHHRQHTFQYLGLKYTRFHMQLSSRKHRIQWYCHTLQINYNDHEDCNVSSMILRRNDGNLHDKLKRFCTFVMISRYAFQKHIHLCQHISHYQESVETRRGMAFQNHLREQESAEKKQNERK